MHLRNEVRVFMDDAWSMVNKCCFEYKSQGPSQFWWRIMALELLYLANNFSPTFPYNRDDDTSAPDNTWAWMKIKDISIHTGEHLCMLWSNGLDSVEGQSTLQQYVFITISKKWEAQTWTCSLFNHTEYLTNTKTLKIDRDNWT